MQPDLEQFTIRDKAGRKRPLTIGIHFQDGFFGLEGKETHQLLSCHLPCLPQPTDSLLLLRDTPQCCAEACGIR